MTIDDKMREIEAALESLIDRAAVGRGVADQRIKVRDLIRAAIAPPAGSHPLCRGEFDVTLHTDGTGLVAGIHFTIKWKKSGMVDRFVPEQADAEHEAKVEAWRLEATSYVREGLYILRNEDIDEALRLMRARPTTEAKP